MQEGLSGFEVCTCSSWCTLLSSIANLYRRQKPSIEQDDQPMEMDFSERCDPVFCI